MNLNLDRKVKEIGKLQSQVRTADDRLGELKENLETRELLEKRQRKISVENDRLKNSVKRVERELAEKEGILEN